APVRTRRGREPAFSRPAPGLTRGQRAAMVRGFPRRSRCGGFQRSTFRKPRNLSRRRKMGSKIRGKGILGIKIGMTSIFTEEGNQIPVTVVQTGPNVVL